MHRTGLVLEGGSFRGIFTAGVLDYLMEQNIEFPYIVGVSAGAGNAINYVSGQKGRTQKVIMHENADPYYGIGQMYRNRTRRILDLDTMLYTYAYEQIPFDFDAFFKANVECEFVSTNCQKGIVEYMKPDGTEDQLLQLCKASCSVPLICGPVKLGEYHYLDGSIIDSVPIMHALTNCSKAVVILTRREGDNPTDYSRMKMMVNISYKSKYPRLAEALLKRREVYEKQMEDLREMERMGKVFVIRPTTEAIGHFEKSPEKLGSFYQHGIDVMKQELENLKAFLAE